MTWKSSLIEIDYTYTGLAFGPSVFKNSFRDFFIDTQFRKHINHPSILFWDSFIVRSGIDLIVLVVTGPIVINTMETWVAERLVKLGLKVCED